MLSVWAPEPLWCPFAGGGVLTGRCRRRCKQYFASRVRLPVDSVEGGSAPVARRRGATLSGRGPSPRSDPFAPARSPLRAHAHNALRTRVRDPPSHAAIQTRLFRTCARPLPACARIPALAGTGSSYRDREIAAACPKDPWFSRPYAPCTTAPGPSQGPRHASVRRAAVVPSSTSLPRTPRARPQPRPRSPQRRCQQRVQRTWGSSSLSIRQRFSSITASKQGPP